MASISASFLLTWKLTMEVIMKPSQALLMMKSVLKGSNTPFLLGELVLEKVQLLGLMWIA